MKTKLLIYSVACASALKAPAYSQTPVWGRQFGLCADDWAYSTTHDGTGGSFVAGRSQMSCGTSNSSQAGFLRRFDALGNALWARHEDAGGVTATFALAVTSDAAGGAFVAGTTDGVLVGTGSGGYDAWIARYDESGSRLWLQQYGTASADGVSALAPGTNGSVLALGYTQYNTTDAVLSLCDSGGAVVWTQTFGTALYDYPHGIASDGLGGAVFVGTTTGSLFGPNQGSADIWIARCDESGSLLWSRQIGTNAWDAAYGVSVSTAGDVFVAGVTTGAFGATPSGGDDAWVAKFNLDGVEAWRRQMGTAADEAATATAPDASGGVFVVGHAGVPFSANSFDAWISRYDRRGDLMWSFNLGTNAEDQALGAIADEVGGLLVVGFTGADLFGSTVGGSDAWLARYSTTYECYLDFDSDGFGTGSALSGSLPCGFGYAYLDGDCDNTNASVYPYAPEICDGLDNNCDGAIDEGFISTYCTAGTTVHGCVPTIAGEGAPSSLAASGFDIVVRSVPGQRYGTLFYGFYPFATPWAPGSPSFKCIASPVTRTGVLDSGGVAGQCNGELRLDFNAWMRANPAALGSPFVAGQVFYAQGWFRDPAAPKQTNLSNGLTFTLCD